MVSNIVQSHLQSVSGPIVWGVDDCCALIHRICWQTHKIRLMAPVRDYFTRRQAALRLREYAGGGVLEAAQRRAEELGLNRARPPYNAAVGVVAGEEGPLLALYHNDKWIARTPDGVAALPKWAAVIAWELPECLG